MAGGSCPMGATLVTLKTAQWLPLGSMVWANVSGEQRILNAQTIGPILLGLRRDLHMHKWKRISGHFAGEGLESGSPCLIGLKRAANSFKSAGRFDLAALTNIVASGGAAASCRANSAALCVACGLVDSPTHRYYQCEALLGAAKEDEIQLLKQTHWVRLRAWECSYTPACLFFRALLPSSWTARYRSETQHIWIKEGDSSTASVVYTDGAGPKRSADAAPFVGMMGGQLSHFKKVMKVYK